MLPRSREHGPSDDDGETSASGDQLPVEPPMTGLVPRGIEFHPREGTYQQFVQAVRPTTVMVPLHVARQLLKAGETAQSHFPAGVDVITTTTIADNQLARIGLREEIAFVTAFEPDYHIPSDYPIYEEYEDDYERDLTDEQRRKTHLKKIARGTLTIADELPDSITVLPLVKGMTPDERAITERILLDVEAPMGVIYGSQFFSNPTSGQFPALKERCEAIATETSQFPMLLIGFLGTEDGVPNRNFTLDALPENVVAAAGWRRWFEAVQPKSSTPAEMRTAYAALEEDVAAALGISPVVAHDQQSASAGYRISSDQGDDDSSER